MLTRQNWHRARTIAACYKAGESTREIGLKFGISMQRVCAILDKQGVERRQRGGYMPKLPLTTQQES